MLVAVMLDILVGSSLILLVICIFSYKIHQLVKEYGYTDISELMP